MRTRIDGAQKAQVVVINSKGPPRIESRATIVTSLNIQVQSGLVSKVSFQAVDGHGVEARFKF